MRFREAQRWSDWNDVNFYGSPAFPLEHHVPRYPRVSIDDHHVPSSDPRLGAKHWSTRCPTSCEANQIQRRGPSNRFCVRNLLPRSSRAVALHRRTPVAHITQGLDPETLAIGRSDSNLSESHFNVERRKSPEAYSVQFKLHELYHTGGLDYASTNEISTELSPAQDCNIRGVAFPDLSESMRGD